MGSKATHCRGCGNPRYAVGYRDAQGAFHRLGGNGPCDCAGCGQTWPSLNPITYGAAREFADHQNEFPCDGEGRYIVITLTTEGFCRHCERARSKKAASQRRVASPQDDLFEDQLHE